LTSPLDAIADSESAVRRFTRYASSRRPGQDQYFVVPGKV
jgi:hypothetical protein